MHNGGGLCETLFFNMALSPCIYSTSSRQKKFCNRFYQLSVVHQYFGYVSIIRNDNLIASIVLNYNCIARYMRCCNFSNPFQSANFLAVICFFLSYWQPFVAGHGVSRHSNDWNRVFIIFSVLSAFFD